MSLCVCAVPIQQQSVGNPLAKISPSNSEAWYRQSNRKSNLHGKLSIQDLLLCCVLSSPFGEKLNGEKHVVQRNHSLHKSRFCVLDGRLLCSLEHGSSHQEQHSVQLRWVDLSGAWHSIVFRNFKYVCSHQRCEISCARTISFLILIYSGYSPA